MELYHWYIVCTELLGFLVRSFHQGIKESRKEGRESYKIGRTIANIMMVDTM